MASLQSAHLCWQDNKCGSYGAGRSGPTNLSEMAACDGTHKYYCLRWGGPVSSMLRLIVTCAGRFNWFWPANSHPTVCICRPSFQLKLSIIDYHLASRRAYHHLKANECHTIRVEELDERPAHILSAQIK